MIALLGLATGTQAQLQIEAMKTKALKADDARVTILGTFVNATLSGDYDKLRSTLHPQFCIYGMDKDSLTADQYIKTWQGYHKEGTDAKGQLQLSGMNVKDGPQAGDWALGWLQASWKHTKSGTTVYEYMQYTARIEDGKIRLIYLHVDNLASMMQLGFKLVPPGTVSN